LDDSNGMRGNEVMIEGGKEWVGDGNEKGVWLEGYFIGNGKSKKWSCDKITFLPLV